MGAASRTFTHREAALTIPSLLGSHLENLLRVKLPMDSTRQWSIPRARKTVDMVRLTLRYRAEQTARVLVIEHDELKTWIAYSQEHKCSIEAESIGPSEIGRA